MKSYWIGRGGSSYNMTGNLIRGGKFGHRGTGEKDRMIDAETGVMVLQVKEL